MHLKRVDCNNVTESQMPLNSLPLYDTTSNMWKSLNTSGPTPPTSNKRIIIFGGLDHGTILGDLWILDIATNQWCHGPDQDACDLVTGDKSGDG
ncbi:40473_t:CDS:2 [Gigaspora margarita]|uniref:40473_t:CDS:1 n=1 Tax=Gigaspora margarita TaxID=4874 RepID=A0ABN7UHS5_GIGMA|nr:40473_t:CDS:2 [Gigaspora margarita]